MNEEKNISLQKPTAPKKKRHLVLVFLIGVAVCITPAYEQLYPGVFRHLTPIYLTFFAFVIYQITRNFSSRTLKTPYWIKVIFILAGLVLFGCIRTTWMEAGLSDTLRIVYVGVVFLMFWKLELTPEERRWGAYGLIVGAILFLLALIKGDFTALVITEKYVNLINRNVIGSLLGTGFCATFYLQTISVKRKKLDSIFLIALMFTFVYFIVTTFSRSSILALLLFMIGYFVSAKKRPGRGLVVLMVIFSLYSLSNVTDYSQKLKFSKGADLEYVSSGRTDIWKSIILAIPGTNFMGVGTANSKQLLINNENYLDTKFGRYARHGAYTHNLGLKLLAENGILALFLYLILIYGLVSFSWRIRSLNNYSLGAVLLSVSFVQFHDYTIAPWFLTALMLPTFEIKSFIRQASK